jgi:hypothetical protein
MRNYKPTRLKLLSLSVMLAFGATAVHAGEREELLALRQTTLNLIQILVQQGMLTQEKAELLVKQAAVKVEPTGAVAASTKPEAGVVRVQYVPESVKKQITDQVREEVIAQAKMERWGDANAVPEWVDRIKIEGDIRMGYQGDMFSKNNAPVTTFATTGQILSNTTDDRNRARLRARLGINAKVTPEISSIVRLATGTTTDPVSTNQTLGQYANKSSFVLDRAYIKAHSDETLPWLTVSAGRIPNPWFGTDLVWDDDVNFEGIALQMESRDQSSKAWRPFGTVGAFPLQEIERSNTVKADSKWLIGAQVGMEWVPSTETRAKVGLAYYDFQNVSGRANPALNDVQFNKTAPEFRQKGNSVFNIDNDGSATTNLWALAADYQVLNVTGMVDLNLFNPVHVILTGDYVENIGYSQSKTLARTGTDITPQTVGYMGRIAIGMPNMNLKNDWQISLAYRYLERDAVLDAFTDSDFHLGGTNNKGYILGGQYSLGKNTWLTARWLSSNQITGLPLATDVLQFYFNAKF